MSAKRNRSNNADQPPLFRRTADEINQAYLADLAQSTGVVFIRLMNFIAPLHQAKIQALRESGEELPQLKP
jgi:hypothetical protein